MKYSRDTEKEKNIPLNETCGSATSANDSVSAVAFFSLRDRLSSVVQHVRSAASGGKVRVEDVHNLRVATRRALAAIKLYRDLLPAKPIASLMCILKVLLRTAGETRDLDVLARRYRKAKSENARHFVKELRKHRARKQRRLSEFCSHLWKNDRLTRRINHLFSKLDDADGSTELFGGWSKARWLDIVHEFSQLSNVDDSNLESLHQFRIRGKGLRYAMELLESTFDQELLPMTYATIAELQERLGHINDQSVAIQLFCRWKRKHHALSKVCSLKAPKRVASRELDQAIAEFKSWWTPTMKTELLQSLTKLADTS